MMLGVEAFENLIGPEGYPLDEATSADSDPSNPKATRRYVAGVEVVGPQGQKVRAPLINYATKARLDAEDAYRKALGENGNLNGVMFPVQVIDLPPQR